MKSVWKVTNKFFKILDESRDFTRKGLRWKITCLASAGIETELMNECGESLK